MTGIYDSGSGGRFAAEIFHKLLPSEPVALVLDRAHAPYGTRSENDLTTLIGTNIEYALGLGCTDVLIACCTASTLYDRLPDELAAHAIPIIDPVARVAGRVTKNGKIAVVGTERTVRSHAFKRAISGTVYEIEAQPLVALIDGGYRDYKIDEGGTEYLTELAEKVALTEADTLILGCTHFHGVSGTLSRIFEGLNKKINIVSSAEVGAKCAYMRVLARSEGASV